MTRALKLSVSAIAIVSLTACETTKAGLESAAGAIDSAVGSIAGGSSYLDETDVCIAQRRALEDESQSFAGDSLKEALGVGLLTGLGTLLVTGDTGAALRNAAIAGGVAFAVGYLTRKQTGGRGPFDVITSFNQDVEEDNARIDRVLLAFDNLNACRKDEAARIQSAFNAGQITRAEAEAQMADVRTRHDQDVERAREITEGIATKSATYAAAYNEIAADNGARALEVRDYEPPARRAQPSVVVKPEPPARQTTTDQVASLRVDSSQQSEVASLRENTVSNVQKRDAAIERVDVAAADSDGFSIA